jgi:RTA1 like protein
MATDNGSHYTTGKVMVEVGLVMQVLFFGFFVVTAGVFQMRMRRAPTSKVLAGGIPWEKHMFALYASSLLILVRSLFRMVEYTQGIDGYLVSHEIFLYVFDTVLMVGVMLVFAWVHPSEVYAMLKGGPGAKAVKKGIHVYNLEFRELQSPEGTRSMA